MQTNYLRDLNATSEIEVGGLDYDRIIETYEKINVDFFSSAHEDQTLLILSHCVFDMSTDELILRQSAYRLLLSFVEFAAALLNGTVNNCKSWTSESIMRFARMFLLKHMGSAMKGEDTVKRVSALI